MDYIKGMIMGAAIGDALGLPYEFNNSKEYCPVIQEYSKLNRFTKEITTFPLGILSDDTELALTLLRNLINNNFVYSEESIIKDYMEWANSGVKFMGKNIRSLFYGIKTIKGYYNRTQKIFGNGQGLNKQSNGSLMRIYPLALLKDSQSIYNDTYLTNPNKLSMFVNLIYIGLLKSLLYRNNESRIIFEHDQEYIEAERNIKEVFKIINDDKFLLTINKKDRGWCIYGLYCALYCYRNFDTFEDAMEWVIKQGGDTDTNASIVGALMGAKLGYSLMSEEHNTSINIDIVKNCEYRPGKYTLNDFDNLCENTLKKMYDNSDITEYYGVLEAEQYSPRDKKITFKLVLNTYDNPDQTIYEPDNIGFNELDLEESKS
jgi:ADP-ribosylglycohydrolase